MRQVHVPYGRVQHESMDGRFSGRPVLADMSANLQISACFLDDACKINDFTKTLSLNCHKLRLRELNVTSMMLVSVLLSSLLNLP